MATMNRTDLESVLASGAAARRDEFSFHSNPYYDVGMDWATAEHMFAWHDRACAWAAGWLRQDEGRDEVMARMLSQRAW